jgi:CubicO group peptidase (beta-lactamase class C family)
MCRVLANGLAVLTALVLATDVLAQTAQPSPSAPDLTPASRAAATLPRLHSLVVSWNGTIAHEYYARGKGPAVPANVKSVSKSVISTLVGIALERKLIPSLDEPAHTYFPELRRGPDRRKQEITIEDLLTMRSGLESTSGQNYGSWVTSRNWVAHALAKPLVAEPGTAMQYSTGSSHLLSAILTKVSGTSTWQFAQHALGQPLGIRLSRWMQDPQGVYFGGNEMLMTPRQMLAYGELYLRRGEVNGKPVVSRKWVDESCVPRTVSRFDAGREYGYGWWIDELGGEDACYAWGYGGQYIFVFRDLNLVVVATSSTAVGDERRSYRRSLLSLIEQHVVGPIVNVKRSS